MRVWSVWGQTLYDRTGWREARLTEEAFPALFFAPKGTLPRINTVLRI